MAAPSRQKRPDPPPPPPAPHSQTSSWTAFWVEGCEQIRQLSKWLRFGLRVKRWLVVGLFGIAVLVAGVDLMLLTQLSDLGDGLNQILYAQFGILLSQTNSAVALTYQVLIGLPLAAMGFLMFLYGLKNALASVTSAVAPAPNEPIVDTIWRRRQLAGGARIVVIGGGTGLSTMLRGLKEYTSNITAVVTVTDDGGSSGRLLREFNMLPPGDIRNCLVALADAEPLMQQLFQYRFEPGKQEKPGAEGSDSGLSGHNFGNLLIAAMLHITGDFEEAVRETSRVLAIRGRVLPATTRQVGLRAEFEDGTVVEGESLITAQKQRIARVTLTDPDADPLEESLEAIRTADAIVIGPGSVYTSVVPNFLVRGVAAAVTESRALKIYVCNVMTQPGETDGYQASDHARAVLKQAGLPVFDHVLINVSEPSEEVRGRYAGVGAEWVLPDVDRVRTLGLRPIPGDFLAEGNIAHHSPDKLAAAIVHLINRRDRPLIWALDRRL